MRKQKNGQSRIIRSIENREDKYILFSGQSGAANAAVAVTCTQALPHTNLLNGISRGTTVQSRIADEVYFTKLHIQGTLNSAVQNWIRMLVVLDKEANGAALALGDLFGSSTPSTLALYNVNNRDIKRRFKVLYDKTLDPLHTTNEYSTKFEIDLPLNFYTSYKLGTAGNIADISTMSMYFIILTNVITASNLIVNYEAMVSFSDF